MTSTSKQQTPSNISKTFPPGGSERKMLREYFPTLRDNLGIRHFRVDVPECLPQF
jgi:hypothetical protein